MSTLIIIAIGGETLYDHSNPVPRQKGLLGRLKLFTGCTGLQKASQRPRLWTVTLDILKIQVRPHILLIS